MRRGLTPLTPAKPERTIAAAGGRWSGGKNITSQAEIKRALVISAILTGVYFVVELVAAYAEFGDILARAWWHPMKRRLNENFWRCVQWQG